MTQVALTGILGTKLGMTQIFDDKNKVVPVTAIKVDTNIVTQIRTKELDGYTAVQLATGAIKPNKVSKPIQGQFNKAGVTPRRHLVEIKVADTSSFTVGQEFTAELFKEQTKVDVVGISKGKGYAGVMKRHGFAGQRASHGAHKIHRAPGSIGGCATPGRVFKGLRMAGRMGHARTTTQNLVIQKIYPDTGVILVKGAIPGNNGGLVIVKTAIKENTL